MLHNMMNVYTSNDTKMKKKDKTFIKIMNVGNYAKIEVIHQIYITSSSSSMY